MNTRWRSSRFSHHVLQYYSITSWLNRMIFSIHRIVAGYNSFQYEVSIEVKLTGWWMFCPTFVSTSSVKTRKERDCRTYSSNFASIEWKMWYKFVLMLENVYFEGNIMQVYPTASLRWLEGWSWFDHFYNSYWRNGMRYTMATHWIISLCLIHLMNECIYLNLGFFSLFYSSSISVEMLGATETLDC